MSKRSKANREQLNHVVDEAKKLTSNRSFLVGLTAGAIVTVAIGIFIFQNNQTAALTYLWFDFDTPLWIGLLASFIAGTLASPLLGWSWRRHRRNRAERKIAEREIREAEKQLAK